ncbi:MAG TPA: NAD(P)-dependent oxidoreductase [Phycisphaerales bacterium]|nr:NAD(P)-dependent oxidoreductase [Phycisphaerales bacterium]HMP38072.1 NAD(P)-dependent oxidoreductase [Phycisphaerales bacterium]
MSLATIGFIGTGVMGRSMAGHLLDAGHPMIVHTRTRSRAAELLRRGAEWAETPRAAAERAEVVISIVGLPEDVESVHLGREGTLAADRRPRLIIDMTTSRPSLARTIAVAARERGVGSLDAPVSGGDLGARSATLSIMVGGDEADVAEALPVLGRLGKTIVRHGGPGAGQHAKMVNQVLIAATMMGLCEGLAYSRAAGLDGERVIESLSVGAAGSWSLAHLAPRILRRDFAPGFFVEHFIKDLGIALDEAARMRLALPALALARQLYEALRARGHGHEGTQALTLLYEALCGAARDDSER